ncbi:MAG: hypothetical protein V2I56_08215 [Desulfobacteraceae bacterium]|jgi:hypothetical protein|nr:hypothetical protein [Desulfobacteraceae bacterium]
MTTTDDVAKNQLSLTVNAKRVPLFFQLLGHGFCVGVQTGCSVKELLCNQLGIHEDYLAHRIKTIFLNAKVVDDVNSAIVDEDATMALSGAMPGLVGAILRSGGFYAPMRSQISHEENRPASQLKKGNITLKLWNLVVKELGPTFLQRGIWLKGQEIRSFIERHGEELKSGGLSAKMRGKALTLDQLQDITWDSDLVLLQVNSNA